MSRWRKFLLTLGALAAAAGGAYVIHRWWTPLFGAGTWGAGGNLVAWVICGALAGLWLRAKLNAHHLAVMAQGVRHHKDAMAHAQACHDVLAVHVADALTVQSEAVTQALGDHHEAVKATLAEVPPANVTNHFHAAPAVAEPEPAVIPEPAPAPVPAQAAPRGKRRM